jgi:protein AaeX
MKFAEVNIFGIYVAPFAVMMVAAWLITIPLRHFGDRLGIARYVWHRALFDFAVYVIVLSLIVLGVGWP